MIIGQCWPRYPPSNGNPTLLDNVARSRDATRSLGTLLRPNLDTKHGAGSSLITKWRFRRAPASWHCMRAAGLAGTHLLVITDGPVPHPSSLVLCATTVTGTAPMGGASRRRRVIGGRPREDAVQCGACFLFDQVPRTGGLRCSDCTCGPSPGSVLAVCGSGGWCSL